MAQFKELRFKKETPLSFVDGIFKSVAVLLENETIENIHVNLNIHESWWSENGTTVGQKLLLSGKYLELRKILEANPVVSVSYLQVSCSKLSGFVFDREKDRLFDILTFKKESNREWDRDPNFTLKAIKEFGKYFTFITETDPVPKGIPDPLKEQLVTYQNSIIEAKKISEKMISDIQSNVSKWDTSIRESKEEIERILAERQKALEQEYDGKNSELKGRIQKFEEEKAQFDTNTRTYVRRKLLEKIDEIIRKQEDFKLSSNTNQKKAVLDRWLTGASLVFFAVFIAYTIGIVYDAFWKATFNWHLLIPASSSLLVSLSMFIWNMRINNQWLREHADAEIMNKKYAADIYRASWIVEMFYEWKDEKKSEMLPELLSSLTTDLFKSPNGSGLAQHPFEDILSSVNKFGKVKISKSGFEIESKKEP